MIQHSYSHLAKRLIVFYWGHRRGQQERGRRQPQHELHPGAVGLLPRAQQCLGRGHLLRQNRSLQQTGGLSPVTFLVTNEPISDFLSI